MDSARTEIYTDHLIRFAMSGDPDNSSRVRNLGRRLGEVVDEKWGSEEWYAPDILRAAKVVACMPSLDALARSEPQDNSVAARVSNNFQNLADRIVYTPSLSPTALFDRVEGGIALQEAKGQFTEIGVLGALWWCIANGIRGESAYALPATRQQDSGKIKRDGYNFGTDIILRTGDRETGSTKFIQVKTNGAAPKAKTYHPNIAVVAVSELVDTTEIDIPYKLLGSLMAGNSVELIEVNKKIDEIFKGSVQKTEELELMQFLKLVRRHAQQPKKRQRIRYKGKLIA